MDNWDDDGSLLAVAEAGLLRRAGSSVRERWPRQCRAMEDALAALAEIESERRDSPDEAAAASER